MRRLLGTTERTGEAEAPLSLSLVARKKAILRSELSKTEQRLRDRTAVLSRLRQHHEELLNVNGQLQQRNCLRKNKLSHLFQSVEQAGRTSGPGGKPSTGQTEDAMPDSAAVLGKCVTMKQLVESLVGKRELLEQGCMGLEESLALKTDELWRARQRLSEASENLQLQTEDVRSFEWAFEEEQAAVDEAESSLRLLGQQQQLESLALEQSSRSCEEEATRHQDLIRAKGSFCAMAAEVYEQLLASKHEATRVWKDSLGKLGRPGATCAKDEEVQQTQCALTSKLEQLTHSVTTAKSTRRELIFRTKQEREMLSLANSSIKAKDDQIEWLERQRAFLDCEYQNLISTRDFNQASHGEAVLACKRTLASIDEEKRVAKTATEQVEGELKAANAALTALNGRLSKERKCLYQQQRKRNVKQKQFQSSSVTLELVLADAKSAQATLEKARSAHQKHQEKLETLVAEHDDLKAKREQLLDQNHGAERMLASLSVDIEAASQLVEARVRTLTDTYLADSDASDWQDVISRINKEVEDTKTNEQIKFQHKCVESAANLRTKYEVMFAALNDKFGRMLQEKQAAYDAALKSMHSVRSSSDNSRLSASLEEVSAPTQSRTTTKVAKSMGRGPGSQLRRKTADTTASGSHIALETTSHPARNGSHTTTASTGVESVSKRDSRDLRHQPTERHSNSSQSLPRIQVDARPPTELTNSTSMASPALSATLSTHSFASSQPDSPSSTTHDSTKKKKLQRRPKPHRGSQLSADSQPSPERVDSATSAQRSSDRRLTPVTARPCQDVAAADAWTPPVVSSSQASLSPRHTSIAEAHQRLAEKNDQARRGNDSSRGQDRSRNDYPTGHTPPHSPPEKQVPPSAPIDSSNKENERPAANRPAPKKANSTGKEGRDQPKRPAGTSLSQIVRSARAKHKSSKKIGTTIARKKAAKRTSLGSGRKKINASGALLSKTISGADKSGSGIIDANSIGGSSAGAARRPSALVSDWFATDSFSFD